MAKFNTDAYPVFPQYAVILLKGLGLMLKLPWSGQQGLQAQVNGH